MSNHERPVPRRGILDIAPYVPGRSKATGGAKLHKLSSNETPLGPSPAALAAYHAVTGAEFHVAAGVYLPGADAGATFNIGAASAVFGGFAGTETNANQRDWSAHETVLSGNLGGGVFAQHVITKGTAQNVIFILMAGAPSHTDTFDFKMIDGVTPAAFNPATIGSMYFPTGLMPKLAARTMDFAVARNVRARSRYDFTERRSWATRVSASASTETHDLPDFCFSLA